MQGMNLKDAIVELIRRSSTDYDSGLEELIAKAAENEEEGSGAKVVLTAILGNIKLARKNSAPLCQDTGFLNFFIDYPAGGFEAGYINVINEAVEEATQKQYLRPNAVESLTGKNSGNNLGLNAPLFNFLQTTDDTIRIRILQKGGGCENCSIQYRLPDTELAAGRDLKGVYRVVMDAALKAQGYGCAPGIFAVGIGGDRTQSYKMAKEQLFRKAGERSENPDLAALELTLLEDINKLGIGPMGIGGKTTALEVFIASQHRHPATFYVSIAYSCWAYRNATMIIKGGKARYD